MPRMKLYIEGSAAMLGWPGSASGAVEHRAGAVFCVSTAMLWNISDLFSLGALFLILFWMKILTLNCRAKPIDHQDVIFALGWPCPQLPQSWKFTLKRCYELGRHSAFFFFDLCVYLFICSLSPWINSWLPFVNLFVLSSEHEKSSGCLGFCLGQLWAQVPLLHFQTLFPDCSKCCQTLNARFLSVTKWLILLEYVVIKNGRWARYQ